jgi:hypothetical protein
MEHRAEPKKGPYRVPWYEAVNWNTVFAVVCWAITIAVVGYFAYVGFKVFTGFHFPVPFEASQAAI